MKPSETMTTTAKHAPDLFIGQELQSGRFGGPTIRDRNKGGAAVAVMISGSGGTYMDDLAKLLSAAPVLLAACEAAIYDMQNGSFDRKNTIAQLRDAIRLAREGQ